MPINATLIRNPADALQVLSQAVGVPSAIYAQSQNLWLQSSVRLPEDKVSRANTAYQLGRRLNRQIENTALAEIRVNGSRLITALSNTLFLDSVHRNMIGLRIETSRVLKDYLRAWHSLPDKIGEVYNILLADEGHYYFGGAASGDFLITNSYKVGPGSIAVMTIQVSDHLARLLSR